jgi:hypothetical protein
MEDLNFDEDTIKNLVLGLKFSSFVTIIFTALLFFGVWGHFANLYLVSLLVGFPAALLLYAFSVLIEISHAILVQSSSSLNLFNKYLMHLGTTD